MLRPAVGPRVIARPVRPWRIPTVPRLAVPGGRARFAAPSAACAATILSPLEIERSIVIGRPIAEVFELVSDARNDPRWCPKVESVEQVGGDAPGPGSRYLTIHRPVPLRPARELEHRCVAWSPPRRIEWLEGDGVDSFEVSYELEEVPGATRLTQRSDARLGVPKLLHPISRRGIANHIARQLRALQGVLESSA